MRKGVICVIITRLLGISDTTRAFVSIPTAECGVYNTILLDVSITPDRFIERTH